MKYLFLVLFMLSCKVTESYKTDIYVQIGTERMKVGYCYMNSSGMVRYKIRFNGKLHEVEMWCGESDCFCRRITSEE